MAAAFRSAAASIFRLPTFSRSAASSPHWPLPGPVRRRRARGALHIILTGIIAAGGEEQHRLVVCGETLQTLRHGVRNSMSTSTLPAMRICWHRDLMVGSSRSYERGEGMKNVSRGGSSSVFEHGVRIATLMASAGSRDEDLPGEPSYADGRAVHSLRALCSTEIIFGRRSLSTK